MINDKKTLDLINEVKKRTAEIKNLENPKYLTNCAFSYTQKPNDSINLHVESDLIKLITIASFLRRTELDYIETAKILEVEAPIFQWQGESVSSWSSDIKTRINKLQIANKRAKLEALEARLNKIISPELKAELELEAIAAELL